MKFLTGFDIEVGNARKVVGGQAFDDTRLRFINADESSGQH